MRARWASFAVGMWIILAPLVLGYSSVPAVLHDVALGLIVCIGSLTALEWPVARFALLAPASWLLAAPEVVAWATGPTRHNELASGLAVLVLTLLPSGKHAADRAPAKMAA